MKRKTKRLTALLLATVTMISSPLTVFAKEDSFAGWDDEAKESVWNVMENTQWDDMQDKLIYKTTQIKTSVKARVSPEVRNMESEVKKVLKASNCSTAYAKEDYTELMLAIIQTVSNGVVSGNDPCKVNNFFPDVYVKTREDSIKILFNHLTRAFATYYNTYNTYPSIYKNDEALGVVIQGTFYGTKYIKSTQKYSVDNTEKFYKNNKELLSKSTQIVSSSFAKNVCDRYRTISANASVTYNGTVTSGMQSIANKAKNNQGIYPCTPDYCAQWVTGVYIAAKAKNIPYGNAIDMWNNYKNTGSTSKDNIPPGAIVCGSGSGYMGSIYGHVGIYIGNGLVANNVGHFSIEPLAQWCSWQSATCQGHRGWIGWVFPGGVPN